MYQTKMLMSTGKRGFWPRQDHRNPAESTRP
jgi:hypothetical protein